MKKLLAICVSVFFIFSCTGGKKSVDQDKNMVVKDSVTVKWVYSSWKNQMDDTNTYSAEVESNEKLSFKFPYNNIKKNKLHIGIRNQSGINEVILYVDEGQFIPDFTNDKGILIRFDSNETQSFAYTMPNDGSLNGIFISDSETFINSIKKSQKATIQSPFYNEGNIILTFETKGLDWNY